MVGHTDSRITVLIPAAPKNVDLEALRDVLTVKKLPANRTKGVPC